MLTPWLDKGSRNLAESSLEVFRSDWKSILPGPLSVQRDES